MPFLSGAGVEEFRIVSAAIIFWLSGFDIQV
jgi:hypothetical protein